MKQRRSYRSGRVAGGLALLGALLGVVLLPLTGSSATADDSTKYLGSLRETTPTAIASGTTSLYGVNPASVVWFGNWSSGAAFPVDEAKALWARGVLPHYTWEPWNPSLGVDAAGQIKLKDIVAGTWDPYIRAR